MLQLNNRTPFEAELTALNDETGVETLYVIVKASFTEGWMLADEPVPVWRADEYYGEPHESSLRYPSEIHLGKTATDILVEGDAWAPGGRPVRQLPVTVSVGRVSQSLMVFGDRRWDQGQISVADPFERMPLTWERAYGGSVAEGDRRRGYSERNPVGRFASAQCTDRSVDGELIPNIEHPQALLRNRDDSPEPVGLGPVAPHWQPRTRFVGTYDQQWRLRRAPFAPEDFSRRFFNVAAPGLVYPGWMRGGEPFELTGMHPDGAWTGQLPEVPLSVSAHHGGRQEPLSARLETLYFQPFKRTVSLTWRASLSCPRDVLSVESVTVSMTRQPR